MNIGLFASGQVGYAVAKFFGDANESLTCLVLDHKAPSELNDCIIKDAGVAHERVYLYDSISSSATLAELVSMELDLIILAWWPYILRGPVLRLARLGCLNFHPSYLPYNRGKHYNFWTLIEDTPFGVTLHFIDEGIDSGDIAYQSIIEKSWEDTGETLYHKAQAEIIRLFIEKFPEIKTGQIPRKSQDSSQGSFHKAIELESASRINLDQNYKARDLLNLLRARTFPPHPGVWFIDQGAKYQVRIEINYIATMDEEQC